MTQPHPNESLYPEWVYPELPRTALELVEDIGNDLAKAFLPEKDREAFTTQSEDLRREGRHVHDEFNSANHYQNILRVADYRQEDMDEAEEEANQATEDVLDWRRKEQAHLSDFIERNGLKDIVAVRSALYRISVNDFKNLYAAHPERLEDYVAENGLTHLVEATPERMTTGEVASAGSSVRSASSNRQAPAVTAAGVASRGVSPAGQRRAPSPG